MYFLIKILKDRDMKENIDFQKILERNACKVEFWFLGWFLIKNKFAILNKIDM